MKTFFKTLTLLFVFLIILSCTEQGTNPPIEQPKDPREMTWTADTLAYPESIQTLMSNILAFNSKDIFIYGHEFFAKGNIYHYDGGKWEVYDLNKYLGGYNVLKMIAFNRNNIWGVGDRGSKDGLIFNYDGSTWTEKNAYAKYYPPLVSIAGENANEFYACGRYGIVWYYKNGNWLADTVKITRPPNTDYVLSSIAVNNNEVFIIGFIYSTIMEFNWNKQYFIRGKYKNFTVVDSMDFTKDNPIQRWGVGELIKGQNGKLYSRGPRGLYEWNGTYWQNFHQQIYHWGLSVFNDNFILTLGKGGAEYYDGESWIDLGLTVLNKYKDVSFRAAWTDGKELFLVGNTFNSQPQKTIVLHGK